MAVNGITTGISVQDLAQMLAERLDRNSDGQVSKSEFNDLMRSLLDTTSSPTLPNAVAVADTTSDKMPVGAMSGFDPSKLADASHATLKYQVGRILQYHPNTPQGLQDALPEIQKLVPGVKITGTNGDKLDFGGYVDPKSGLIGVIDVLQSAGLGGCWQWSPVL
ncbi:MAG: hypothetical protein R2752_11790 [Vicinamibacterales bacterium]